jgi:hypothetical protein
MAVLRTTGAGIRAISPSTNTNTNTTSPRPAARTGNATRSGAVPGRTRTIRGSGKAPAFRGVTAAPGATGAPQATGSRCARCGRIRTGRTRNGPNRGRLLRRESPPGSRARSGHPARVTTRATRVPALRPGPRGPRVRPDTRAAEPDIRAVPTAREGRRTRTGPDTREVGEFRRECLGEGPGCPGPGQGLPELGRGRPELGRGRPELGRGRPELGRGRPELDRGLPGPGRNRRVAGHVRGQGRPHTPAPLIKKRLIQVARTRGTGTGRGPIGPRPGTGRAATTGADQVRTIGLNRLRATGAVQARGTRGTKGTGRRQTKRTGPERTVTTGSRKRGTGRGQRPVTPVTRATGRGQKPVTPVTRATGRGQKPVTPVTRATGTALSATTVARVARTATATMHGRLTSTGRKTATAMKLDRDTGAGPKTPTGGALNRPTGLGRAMPTAPSPAISADRTTPTAGDPNLDTGPDRTSATAIDAIRNISRGQGTATGAGPEGHPGPDHEIRQDAGPVQCGSASPGPRDPCTGRMPRTGEKTHTAVTAPMAQRFRTGRG